MNKKILSILTIFCLLFSCVILFSACGKNTERTEFAVYYIGELNDYNIEAVDFCSYFDESGTTNDLETYVYTSEIDSGKTGVEKQYATGEMYIAVTLKDKTNIATLKMQINGADVNLEEKTVDSITRYIYKFDSMPSNAKITFSGKAEYITSTFQIEFMDIADTYSSYEGYTSARFILRLGDEYLIGNTNNGVDYQTFKNSYNNINKSWLLSENLCLDVYFTNTNYFLSNSNFIFAEKIQDDDSFHYPIDAIRKTNDGVVSMMFSGFKEGVKFTINPNCLAEISTNLDFTMGYQYLDVNINDVKYIINSTESNSLTYSQIKDVNEIKVKIELDEFSKTLINSDKTHLILNSLELTNEIVVDGNYAIFSLKKPWEYYNELWNSNVDLLTYYLEVAADYCENTQNFYSLDEIFADNANITKIDFSGVNTLNESTSPYSGYAIFDPESPSALYVGICNTGNNYFNCFRIGNSFSITCKIACFTNNNKDYTKKIVLTINENTPIELNYVDEILSCASDNVVVTTNKTNNEIVTITFNNYDVNSIQFTMID